MIRKLFLSIALLPLTVSAADYRLTSPDGGIVLEVACGDSLTYRVEAAGEIVFTPSPLAMTFTDGTVWGVQPKVVKKNYSESDSLIPSPLYRKSSVRDRYKQLTLTFRGGYGVDFRAYDDGVAYRFFSLDDTPRTVTDELVRFNFAADHEAVVPYVLDREGTKKTFAQQFNNSFENVDTPAALSELDPQRLMFLPLAVRLPSGRTVCITEADLESYPGMYLNHDGRGTSLRGVFPPCPKATRTGGHNNIQRLVTETEPYIARIGGARTFPWRAAAIVAEDAGLLDCDLVYRLGAPCRLNDTAWIRPGQTAWEWWNDWGVYGVDFKSGINTETYKHYIDFAAEYGLEYVLLDEGWSRIGTGDLYQVVPELDLPEVVAYANEKGVGVLLWAGYAAIDRDFEGICRHYAAMGVKGFKIDFFDRDDQELVEFVYHAAETAARYRLVLNLHGMYKPTGLQRTYPNLINFEGVFGLERVKWTSPEEADPVLYDVTVPFIRQFAGPMDYTQGAMLNANRKNFRARTEEPMSLGTRCRQLAEYIVFESPLAMLCDSPAKYRDAEECARFIASVPTVWDQTRPLAGRIGEYVATARRKGRTWYLGGITDWNARTLTLDLGMLGEGDHAVTLFRDGVNADRYAQDYKCETFRLGTSRQLTVEMAPGGGFAASITPINRQTPCDD